MVDQFGRLFRKLGNLKSKIMGTKGSKMTYETSLKAEEFMEKMAGIDGITYKKMFGGFGFFCNEKMFGIISPEGEPFLKASDSNKALFENAGSSQHSRMPYFSIPAAVWNDPDELREWIQKSIAITL